MAPVVPLVPLATDSNQLRLSPEPQISLQLPRRSPLGLQKGQLSPNVLQQLDVKMQLTCLH